MRIYVATKWENSSRAQEVAAWLEKAGHEITHRWWENEQVTPEAAANDYYGVVSADALVLIVEHKAEYSGALVEFGIALGTGRRVYVMGHAIDHNIFLQLPQIIRVDGPHQLLSALGPAVVL